MTDGPLEYAFRGIDPLEGISIGLSALAGDAPLALLRALVPLPQTVKGDLVVGLDFELGMTFTVPPVFAPMPFLFAGMVDCKLSEVAVPRLGPQRDKPGGDEKVTVWGLPATMAGKKAEGVHIPMGAYAPMKTPVTPKLKGKSQLLYGSASVDIEGAHAVRLAEMGMNCSIADPLPTPTTRVLSATHGSSFVFTGGASVPDLGAMAVAVVTELAGSMVGSLFGDFAADVAKDYVGNVIEIFGEAEHIARTERDPARRVERVEQKMAEIFTEAPFEALASATSDGLLGPFGL